MPVYDYKCKEHGLFYALQTMDAHDKPNPCPKCGKMSSRVILMAPEILTMDKNTKQGLERNERSKFEPLHSTRDQRAYDKQHQRECGCNRNKNKSKLFYTAKGEKMFPSMRPWMISH